MILGGLQKTTLIDFPGRVACTVFTVGCNFRCPFCHNKDLVTLENFKEAKLRSIAEEDFFSFLEKRKKILDGVCITGGEPTIYPDLPQFCQKIKKLGLEVKLDTNGSCPKMTKLLIKKRLVDFIAMDVKLILKDYSKAAGLKTAITAIKESIKIILRSGLEYELRTTVVPTIHNQKNLVKLAKELKSFDPRVVWFLQKFQAENCLDKKFLKIKSFTDIQMKQFLKAVQKVLPQTKLRGLN